MGYTGWAGVRAPPPGLLSPGRTPRGDQHDRLFDWRQKLHLHTAGLQTARSQITALGAERGRARRDKKAPPMAKLHMRQGAADIEEERVRQDQNLRFFILCNTCISTHLTLYGIIKFFVKRGKKISSECICPEQLFPLLRRGIGTVAKHYFSVLAAQVPKGFFLPWGWDLPLERLAKLLGLALNVAAQLTHAWAPLWTNAREFRHDGTKSPALKLQEKLDRVVASGGVLGLAFP